MCTAFTIDTVCYLHLPTCILPSLLAQSLFSLKCFPFYSHFFRNLGLIL